MENWKLTAVILASVLVGSLIPVLVMAARAVLRASREVAEIAVQLKRTLIQVEVISGRVEVLSRGLEGGETSIAELLASAGTLARGLDRNMKTINIISTVLASIGTAVAGYAQSQFAGERPKEPIAASEPAPRPATASPGTDGGAVPPVS